MALKCFNGVPNSIVII